MLRKVLPVISFVCLPLFTFSQLSISAVKTSFVVDFNNTISGVSSGSFSAPSPVAEASPGPGALDRDAFQISSSAGTAFNWPGSPVDVSVGKGVSTGGANQAGIYAYTNNGGTNRILGVSPNGSNFIPGAIILRAQNNTGSTITQFDLSYKAYAYNGSNGSATLTFYYSTNGTTWTAASDMDYASTGSKTDAWESASKSVCVPALNIADGAYFYLKWVIDGASSPDEIGIDDIQLIGRTPLVGFTTSASVVAELDPDGGNFNQTHSLTVYMEAPPISSFARISISTMDSTAIAPTDYAALSGLLMTFLPSECYPQSRTLPLNLKRDLTIEANEVFKVILTLVDVGTTQTGTMTHYVTIANDDVPASSTLYSRLSMSDWSASGMWSTQRNGGGGTIVPDPNNLIGSGGPEYNLVIQPGHIVTLDGDKGINTLEIEKSAMDANIKGKLFVDDQNTVYYLQVYGNSVDVDGTIGNGSTRDGVSLEIRGSSCNLTGSGDIDLFRIRKDGDQDSDLDIQSSLNLRGTDGVLYNNADGYSFNPEVMLGTTVTAFVGDVSIDGEDGTSPNDSRGTLTINGILDIQDGDLYLKTNNPTSGTGNIIYSIGTTGILKIGGTIIGNEGNSGSAIAQMSIASAGELQLSGSNDLFVNYSDTRNSTVLNSNSIINLSGLLTQMLPPLPFYGSLTLSGGGDKTLQANATILGTLNLQSGDFKLGDFNLTINSTGSISGGSPTSYVKTDGNGVLIQQVTSGSSFVFPVGNSSYNPATLDNTAGTQNDNYQVRVVDQVLSNGTFGTAVTEEVVGRTWLIDEETAGGSSVTLILQWFSGDETMGFDRDNCYIGHYLNGVWEQSNIPTASNSQNGGFVLTASGIDEFSPFVVATAGAILPVELAYFRAYAKEKTAILEWSTESELNNDEFVIERSADLRTFEAIGIVDGQGNSQIQHDYTFIDKAPLAGTNYYRLKQIDFDGTFSYSEIETVKFGQAGIQIWPNPVRNTLNILLEGPSNQAAVVDIYTISGQKIRSDKFQQLPDRISVEGLAQGHYFLEIRLENEVQRMRFVKY